MKMFLTLCMLFVLVGCDKSCEDETNKFNLPKELEGYKVCRLQSDSGVTLYVVIPPNSAETKPAYLVQAPSKVDRPLVVIIGDKRYKLVEEESNGR